MREKVLVAGASGRVGGAAVRHLLEAGYEVRALVRSADKGEPLRSLGAEAVVGDVTEPSSLALAVEGCSGVYAALAAGPGRGNAREVEYQGNLNLLSAAEEAGVSRFVYSSALLVDHPMARMVGVFREKWRFEEVLLRAEGVSPTILRPAMFMETLLLALRGPLAFVPGRQRRPASWISASDVALAAVRAFEKNITGRHELAGPDLKTFDEAYEILSRARERKIQVLHPPLWSLRVPGLILEEIRELANMFALFDAVAYNAESTLLRETFGVEATTLEEWANIAVSVQPSAGAPKAKLLRHRVKSSIQKTVGPGGGVCGLHQIWLSVKKAESSRLTANSYNDKLPFRGKDTAHFGSAFRPARGGRAASLFE